SDANGVEALGGVIGGQPTGCETDTTEVFLEVALFDPIRTAQTGRKLGIISDARYRFERGLDPAFVHDGLEIATRLILDLCGGEASEPTVTGQAHDVSRSYHLRHNRCETLGGVEVPVATQQEIQTKLGFGVTPSGDGLDVSVPSWRGDVIGEADLVEEVLRVRGFDDIPVVQLPRMNPVTRSARSPVQRRVADARRALSARGLLESVTFSFMSSEKTHLFGGGNQPGLKLLNPISADLDEMRPSVLPNLVEAAARNADRGFPDLGLFEVGPQFAGPKPADQAMVAAGIRMGRTHQRHWKEAPRAVDAFDAKADALAILAACGAPAENAQISTDAPEWYHPGRSGALRLGPKVLAWFGEVHPMVARDMDVKGPLVAFEVFLDAIPQTKSKGGKTRAALALSAFQPISRDFAFVVEDTVPADKLVRAAKGADKALITGVSVFDIYQGQGVADGHKSLAIAVTLQPTDQTLTEEQIEAVSQKIVANVQKQTGGTLRG
ncbi:MAG: phenylalanine--tRNA ligase subunit beta, partial [Pseudomonadota bacterium]